MSWIGVITNVGASLLAQWQMGSETLTIDGVTVGSGVTAEVNMRQATALVSEKAEASIVSTKALIDATEFKVQVGPATDLIGAYTAHEIGVWGHLGSGDPVLIALHQDSENGVAVPLASVSPEFVFSIYFTHAISNDGTLVITTDPSAYVSGSTMEETIDELSSTMREVPFAIAADEWELTDGMYQATFLSDYVTYSCKFKEFYDSSIRTAATADITAVKKDGGGGVVFTTEGQPTGTLSGTLWVFDTRDGKIPVIIEDTTVSVANGGTGASTAAGARGNLGLGTASDAKTNLGFGDAVLANVANNLTETEAGSVLDARQGKALYDQVVKYSDVVDNLASTAADKPLSAGMGKYLSDQIGTINSKLRESTVVEVTTLSTKGSQEVNYPSGYSGNNSIIITTCLYIYGNWYMNADNIFNYTVANNASKIYLDLTNVEDRALSKPVRIVLFKFA